MHGNEHTTEDGSALPLEADRSRRLFLYLRDLAELRTKSVRDTAEYDDVVWLKDLPTGPHAWSRFDADPNGTDSEVWLEIDRIQLPKVPQPPDHLRGWIRLSNLSRSDLEEPGLVDPDEAEAELPDDVRRDYEEYLSRQWRPWRRDHLERKPLYDFYTRLFSLGEKRSALGEVYELVLGFGLLTWNRRGHRIRRHLLTSPAELIVDDATGAIELRPSDAEGRNRLELDMLEPHDRGPAEVVQELTPLVEGSDPLALGELTPDIAGRWVNRAHAEGHFEATLDVPNITDHLTIGLTPAIILRRRGQRTLATLLGGIADQIGGGGELPEGVTRLVTTDDAVHDEGGSVGFSDPEVYFPLPSNEEQTRILDRMTQRRGVVVQGPPGTGKSHTIANLVTHLLAQGKRVLVTSHTERALKVLRDKLPEDIRPLCISLLGSDRQSIRDLEAAVESISVKQGDWSPEETAQAVQSLRSTLNDVRGRKAEKTARLRRISESDAHAIDVGPYHGTSQQIARRLAAESEELAWIPDAVTDPSPPLSNDRFREYLTLTWTLTSQADDAADADLPDPQELVTAGELGNLFEREAEFARRRADAASRFGDWVERLDPFPDEALSEASQAIRAYATELRRLTDAVDWTQAAVRDVIASRTSVWSALLEDVSARHDSLDAALSTLNGASVEVNLEKPLSVLRSATRELIEYAEGGSTLRTGLFAMGAARRHRDLLEGVRVDGAAPLDTKKLRRLDAYLTVQHDLASIAQSWHGRVDPLGERPFTQQQAAYGEHKALLERTLALEDSLAEVKGALDGLWVVPRPDRWDDAADLEELARGLSTELDNRRSAEVSRAIADARSRLGDDAHPTVARLREAVDARSADAYRAALSELEEKRRLAAHARRRSELSEALASAPMLRSSIPSLEDDEWLERADRFDRAWAWRHADTTLERMLDPDEPRRLTREIEDLDRAERSALLTLTTELAWDGMFKALSSKQSQALTAWTYAIKRIGRGAGKYAEKHRRTAREYMGMARDAIPAWIMPTYRVAESLDAAPEPFDVVIVDEASQSGVESLFLFYIGKQVVVVGDDQQIAPEAVGIDMMEVDRLQRQHLQGLPFSDEFGPTSSLFNQADIRFGNRVVLREHFRCMPEIIEFSNRISYPEKSLWPLRQYGAGRLDPIKTVYLEHGYRAGGRKAVNRPEAEEIVARIEKLCADPRYDDKTIGVISLQGDAQAQLIDRLLIERLGPQLMAERSIICGDAYAFQGDERHVMFLSMVAAPNERIGALSNAQARRRFNVAGSRAQDQVWLVHSVRPSDLSTTDMRKEMLEYYLNPDVEHWEELQDFDDSVLNDPFESRFEQDVYLKLRERGYRVTPQVRTGGYRVDLVVEGAAAKLAVECDGDEWHGADRWEADSLRQRRLERAGWTFVRIRGSEFYRDPRAALEPVWRACERLGIEPGSQTGGEVRTAEDPITGPENGVDARTDHDEPEIAEGDGVASPAEDADHEVDEPGPSSEVHDGEPGEYDVGSPTLEHAASAGDRNVDETESDLSLGTIVYHQRLGRGRVTGVAKHRERGAPWVRIRFDHGEFAYTPQEFLDAGFTADEAPTISDSVQASTEPSESVRTETRSESIGSEHEAHRSSASEEDEHDESQPVDGTGLAPYRAWRGDGLPDPRDSDRSTTASHLREIIEVEGPLTADRLYKLYIRGAGSVRVTRQARRPLNSALYLLARRIATDEFENPETNWPQRVVRLPDTPSVVVRELGERDLYEVPLNEIAELMRRKKTQRRWMNREDLMRFVLDTYGLVRLTNRVENYLQAAIDLIDEEED